MKILLIGNFSSPHDDETLHNFSLLNKLKEEGNDCSVIDISKNSMKEIGFLGFKHWISFLYQLVRNIWKKDVMHYMTKTYNRPSLMKLMSSVCIAWFFRAKPVISLHSEMFSIIGKTRSKLLGEPSVRITLYLAHKVISGDKETFEALEYFKSRDNFELIPLFMNLTENLKEDELPVLNKLNSKKKVIVFADVIYPSFAFDILNYLLSRYPIDPDVGIVLSLHEKPSKELQQVIEEFGSKLSDNLFIVESAEMQHLLLVYKTTDYAIRPLTCDGEPHFADYIVSVRRPVLSANQLSFPDNLLFVKGGEAPDLYSSIINYLLMDKPDETTRPDSEIDYYGRIKEIYLEQ